MEKGEPDYLNTKGRVGYPAPATKDARGQRVKEKRNGRG